MSYWHINMPEERTICGMMHTKRKMVKTKSENYDLVLIEMIIPGSLTSSSWPVVVDCDWRLFWAKTINLLVSSRKWIFSLHCMDSLAHSEYTTPLYCYWNILLKWTYSASKMFWLQLQCFYKHIWLFFHILFAKTTQKLVSFDSWWTLYHCIA